MTRQDNLNATGAERNSKGRFSTGVWVRSLDSGLDRPGKDSETSAAAPQARPTDSDFNGAPIFISFCWYCHFPSSP